MTWRDRANCNGYEHLYDGEGVQPSTARARQALRRCAMCPVRAECLHWGLTDRFLLELPIWDARREHLAPVVHEYRMADSFAIFGGTLLADRRAVADRPVDEQERVLTEQFRRRALGLIELTVRKSVTGWRLCAVCCSPLPRRPRHRTTCSTRCRVAALRIRRQFRRAPLVTDAEWCEVPIELEEVG